MAATLYSTAGALGLGELGFHKPPWPKQNKTKTKQKKCWKVVRELGREAFLISLCFLLIFQLFNHVYTFVDFVLLKEVAEFV